MRTVKRSRRDVLRLACLAAASSLLAGQSFIISGSNEGGNQKMIVRVSTGKFEAANYEKVAAWNRETERRLIDGGMKKLPGLLNFYSGVDQSGTMVQVSHWDTLEHAKQLDTFAPMRALRPEGEKLGVRFEPISNNEVLWQF